MRTTLGAIALALATLNVAVPATADQVVVRDRTGDVQESRVDESVYVLQSDIREGDVIATSFRHGPRAVVVHSRFRALDRIGHYHGYYLRLETGRHLYREVTVEAVRGAWAGRLVVTNRRGKPVRCGATYRIDYLHDAVRVVVPRACLGRPRLVRGTAANAWTRPDRENADQPDLAAVDNPHNTDVQADTWTRWIRRG